jgi:hypothetical protein
VRRYERPTSPPTPVLAVGETWKVHDVRKGDLTLKLTEVGDGWAQGEIVEGKVSYAAIDNRLAQRLEGLGTRGDVITVSFTLCEFVEKIENDPVEAEGPTVATRDPDFN